jgi:hypothetical protein
MVLFRIGVASVSGELQTDSEIVPPTLPYFALPCQILPRIRPGNRTAINPSREMVLSSHDDHFTTNLHAARRQPEQLQALASCDLPRADMHSLNFPR